MQDKQKIHAFSTFQKYQNPIKVLLFMLVLWLIYLIIRQKGENIENVKQQFELIFSVKNAILLVIVVLLTPVNWAFEALKWQKLAQKIEQISFLEACKGVLAGLTLSHTTPFMAGDYAAKIWLLKSSRRTESFGAILLGNAMQLYVSLFFGTLSYIFFIVEQRPTPLYFHIIFSVILTISLISGIILVKNRLKIGNLITRFSVLKPFQKYLIVLEKYNSNELLTAIFFASSRYVVFTCQFVLVLLIFDIDLPILTLFCGVGMIFLAKTIVPFINFASDFGVRQMASFYYFSYYHVSPAAIATATTLIWLINILFPLLIGAVFILKFRLTLKP